MPPEPPTVHLPPPPLPPAPPPPAAPPAPPDDEDEELEDAQSTGNAKTVWWQRKPRPGTWWPSKVAQATAAGEVVEDTFDEDDEPAPAAAPPYAWVVPQELIEHLTPHPPPAPSGDPKKAARIRALWISGIGAAVGWFVGLGPGIYHAIEECGRATSYRGGITLGIGFFIITAVIEAVVRSHIPYPIAYWISRGPTATAFLALALYTPNATL